MTRQVSREEAQSLADSLNIEYTETSAKDDVNVTQAYARLTEMLMHEYVEHSERVAQDKATRLSFQSKKIKPRVGCC